MLSLYDVVECELCCELTFVAAEHRRYAWVIFYAEGCGVCCAECLNC